MNFDIRTDESEEITSLQCNDGLYVQNCGGCVFITIGLNYDANSIGIYTKEDADNLSKALEKAIELKWWD